MRTLYAFLWNNTYNEFKTAERRSADRQTEGELILTQVANVNSQAEDVLYTRGHDKVWTTRQNMYVEFN